jgi:hypothetical protein
MDKYYYTISREALSAIISEASEDIKLMIENEIKEFSCDSVTQAMLNSGVSRLGGDE